MLCCGKFHTWWFMCTCAMPSRLLVFPVQLSGRVLPIDNRQPCHFFRYTNLNFNFAHGMPVTCVPSEASLVRTLLCTVILPGDWNPYILHRTLIHESYICLHKCVCTQDVLRACKPTASQYHKVSNQYTSASLTWWQSLTHTGGTMGIESFS